MTEPKTPKTPKTLRAKNPADLLAMVPYLLGFHPEDSVVVVTIGAAPVPVHARQDLPAEAHRVDGTVLELVEVATQAGVDRVAVIVYTDDPAFEGAVARPLAEAMAAAGVGVPVCLRADGRRWYCLGTGQGACPRDCPPDGTPYDVSSHPITLQAVVDGRVVHRDRDGLRRSLLGEDPDEIRRVEAALSLAADRMLAACRHSLGAPDPEAGRGHLVQEGRWVQHRIGRFLRDGVRLDSHDVGRMVVAIASIEVRDVAWAQIGHADARRHVDLWRDVVRRSPLETLAAPAALLGFAAWLAGEGALAWCAVERSQEAEPGYGLAGLVTQALAGAVPPQTWTPLGPDALSLFAG